MFRSEVNKAFLVQMYTQFIFLYIQAAFGSNWASSILMDDVACSGTEASLDQCGHRGWAVHNCCHREDAGVRCDVSEEDMGKT